LHLESLPDDELVPLAQQGDEKAFEVLYWRYLPRVYNRARALVPEEMAEDVTQEIFLAVARSLPGFRGRSSFSTWVYAIANHKISDFHRRAARERRDDVDQEFLESLADGSWPRQEERVMVREALWRLPERYREVLVLRFAEGLPFKEIAVQLNLSLEATKSLYRRAIARARQELTTA